MPIPRYSEAESLAIAGEKTSVPLSAQAELLKVIAMQAVLLTGTLLEVGDHRVARFRAQVETEVLVHPFDRRNGVGKNVAEIHVEEARTLIGHPLAIIQAALQRIGEVACFLVGNLAGVDMITETGTRGADQKRDVRRCLQEPARFGLENFAGRDDHEQS